MDSRCKSAKFKGHSLLLDLYFEEMLISMVNDACRCMIMIFRSVLLSHVMLLNWTKKSWPTADLWNCPFCPAVKVMQTSHPSLFKWLLTYVSYLSTVKLSLHHSTDETGVITEGFCCLVQTYVWKKWLDFVKLLGPHMTDMQANTQECVPRTF